MSSKFFGSINSPHWSLALMIGPGNRSPFLRDALHSLAERFFTTPPAAAEAFFDLFSTVAGTDIPAFRSAFDRGLDPSFLLSLITKPQEVMSRLGITRWYRKPSVALKDAILTDPPRDRQSLFLLAQFAESQDSSNDDKYGLNRLDRNAATRSLRILTLPREGCSTSLHRITGSHPILRASSITDTQGIHVEITRILTTMTTAEDVSKLCINLRKLADLNGTLGAPSIRAIITKIHCHMGLRISDVRYERVLLLLHQINPVTTITEWEKLSGQPWPF